MSMNAVKKFMTVTRMQRAPMQLEVSLVNVIMALLAMALFALVHNLVMLVVCTCLKINWTIMNITCLDKPMQRKQFWLNTCLADHPCSYVDQSQLEQKKFINSSSNRHMKLTSGMAVEPTLKPKNRNAALPSSEQWHPGKRWPLLPSTVLFQGIQLSSAGLE